MIRLIIELTANILISSTLLLTNNYNPDFTLDFKNPFFMRKTAQNQIFQHTSLGSQGI